MKVINEKFSSRYSFYITFHYIHKLFKVARIINYTKKSDATSFINYSKKSDATSFINDSKKSDATYKINYTNNNFQKVLKKV